ncbi:MAG: hypothetical protein ACLTDR_09810 [Adlercreutzia equolifaciens]
MSDGDAPGFSGNMIGLPYTGYGAVWSSATAMNKKPNPREALFTSAKGIPTAPYQYIKKGEGYSVQELALACGRNLCRETGYRRQRFGYLHRGRRRRPVADAIERVFRNRRACCR